jgi:alkanesulfonate monooxygenase SsuD/methylene tetrahydromethanopterin reductase-like flavin-dependent oxidoreductase (luciferase family)
MHLNVGILDFGDLDPLRIAPAYRVALLDGRPDLDMEGVNRKLRDVVAYLRNTREVVAAPPLDRATPVWHLGGSIESAEMAAENGVAFCVSLMHREELPDRAVLFRYRERFRPSRDGAQPHCAIALAGTCAPNDEEACGLLAMQAKAPIHARVVGSPERCRQIMVDLAEQYGTTEVVFLDVCQQMGLRLRSLTLLAKALEIGARVSAHRTRSRNRSRAPSARRRAG